MKALIILSIIALLFLTGCGIQQLKETEDKAVRVPGYDPFKDVYKIMPLEDFCLKEFNNRYEIHNFTIIKAYTIFECYERVCLPIKGNLTEEHCSDYELTTCNKEYKDYDVVKKCILNNKEKTFFVEVEGYYLSGYFYVYE